MGAGHWQCGGEQGEPRDATLVNGKTQHTDGGGSRQTENQKSSSTQ